MMMKARITAAGESAQLIPPAAARPFLIAGPCVLESETLALEVAGAVAAAAARAGLFFVFKSSYLKDNRTSRRSFVGPGLEAGLRILEKVRRELGIPVVTDVHTPAEAAPVAASVDMLQIPAFLCRQSSLLTACAATGRPLNLKKGQFLAPADMAQAVAKVRAANPSTEILLTERGSSFGYRDLVVDMRGLALMRRMGCRVVFDATHSLQRPGSGGDRRFVRPLARAALGAGAEGIFAEVHPDPDAALCDTATQLPLHLLPGLLQEWAALGRVVGEIETEPPCADGADWPGLEAPEMTPATDQDRCEPKETLS